MPTLKITLSAELDGVQLAGYPKTRRLEVDESQSFSIEQATGGGYSTLPIQQLGEVQALILEPDQAVTLRLDAQSDAGLEINKGGLIVLFDVTINAGASTNATIDNASGSTVKLVGIAGGT